MNEVVQDIVNWLALGSIYALLALGIAVVFSVLGLINFAHGQLVVVAGYSMLGLANLGLPWAAIIVLSVLATALAAVLMERLVYRPFRGSPITTTLLASLAVSFLIQNLFLMFLGGREKAIPFPSWTHSSTKVAGVVIQTIDLLTLGTTILLLASLMVFLRRSVRGLALRAAAENFSATRLMGIPANRMISGAFAVSGLLAGFAGFFFLANGSVVGPNSGFTPLLEGFIAAVIGGLGSLSGAVIGGFFLAGLETLFQIVLPADLVPFIDAFVFSLVMVVLIVRPHGLSADAGALVERV
jgi:branched-chain amino acid transport system permease protein